MIEYSGVMKMIYSADINRICALCRNAEKLNDDEIYCSMLRENMSASYSDCPSFDYDIFKKTVKRKKRLKTNFSAKDFSLD